MVLKQEKTGNSYVSKGNFLILILVSMILMSNAASAGSNGTILVASNRYVVLDDPNTGSFSGTGFKNPTNSWGSNLFSGSETTITMWAMVMDKNGTPIPNTNVNFTLKNPVGTVDYTFTKSTDSNGLVNLSRDLNTKNYYGKWQVIANATSLGLNDSTSFIYNWWGCGGGACGGHGSKTLSSGAPVNSPYSSGHDTAVNSNGDHRVAGICVDCHLSYNGQGSASTMNTLDTHRNISCDNTSCHGNITQHRTNMVIGSCSNCHNRTDISDKNTLNGIVSNYSNSTSIIYNRYHTPNSTVPCIICHGPMHNITKPEDSQRFIKNNDTESSQCTTCHSTYSNHNGGLNCTLCHSDDVHAIKVFAQNATYVTLNHNNPNPARGNCTNCHQNATFFNTLKSNPKAGSYTGSAPQVQTPLNHSTDSAGTKWGTYWTSQKDACIYCHGDNKHNGTRLGDAAAAVGTDTIGGPIGTGTVCSSCHNQSDSNYNAVMALLIPNPVAIKSGLNWNMSGTDHASYGTTDAVCLTCHNNSLSGSADIADFLHNVGVGKGGGPDCVSCHDIGASQEKVDVSKMNTSLSIHNTLNSGATATKADNKRCYACHTNSSVSADGVVNQAELPTGAHPDNYKVPKNCMDCHDKGNFSALIVKEHNSAGSEIKTKTYANINDSCVNCHNKTEMIITNNDPAGPKSEFAKVSHYGSNKTGISPYNVGGASNCTFCHQGSSAFSSEMVNAALNSNIDNHTELSSNPGCSNCHNSGRIHDSVLTKPILALPNSSYCQTCHTTVQKHNNAVNCTQCHLATNKSIHPVQYLQPSGTFLINSAPNKASAVNCTSCHQGTLAGFNTASQVKTPISHSNDNSGQKWGTYWTSQKDSCLYCHGNSKHNISGLGKALTAIGSDTIGGSIGTGTLCSSCHNSADGNYTAIMNLLIPDPVANVAGFNYNSSGINHASYGVTDADCLPCHGSALSVSPTISEFPHNVASATGCTACHGQPPSGAIRNNTDGAHTLHMDAGYGNVPETSCNYCHSNGGINDNNGAKHPNAIYNVSFNASVPSITYTLNTTSGSDDACAGVSCHTNGLSTGAKAGTAIWNGSTAGRCNVCHSLATSGIPSTGSHSTKHYNMSKGYMCANCHGTNADSGAQIGHKDNGIIDVAFTGIAAPGTFNSLTKTCNAYCHSPNINDPKPNPTWGTALGACGTACHSKPPTTSRAGLPLHTGVTGSSDCEGCHGPGANNGTQAGHVNGVISGGSCTGCHNNVDSTILGRHANLSDTLAVEDSDCQICHFGAASIIMIAGAGTGAANHSNTYFCEDCHNGTYGIGPVKPNATIDPNLVKTTLKHGKTDCKWCHIAGDPLPRPLDNTLKYHAKGPKGTATGNDCITCHVNNNLPDSPFHAPGEVHATTSPTSCPTCHASDNHGVKYIPSTFVPILENLIITSSVESGNFAEVQATLKDNRINKYVQMAAAQYQVQDGSGNIVIDWTNMTAKDGRFSSSSEIVNASINTSNLLGTYRVYINGMSSAPKTNIDLPYYPFNGRWSGVAMIPLIVNQPMGYVTGSVKNGSNAIAGATVSTNNGISAITDSNGLYSLNLDYGSYQLTASKNPEYYPMSVTGITIGATPATQNFNLNVKPTGTISGKISIK